MAANTHRPVTPGIRKALKDLMALGREARGDHPRLAELRRIHAEHMDRHIASMKSHGFDVETLMDEIDAELDAEEETR